MAEGGQVLGELPVPAEDPGAEETALEAQAPGAAAVTG